MDSIAVFELMSGKTIIARYQEVTIKNGTGEVIEHGYELEKPMIIQHIRTTQGSGVAMTAIPGLYPRCIVFRRAIAGENTDAVDKGMVDQYIKHTTGIQIASSVPPPNSGRPV